MVSPRLYGWLGHAVPPRYSGTLADLLLHNTIYTYIHIPICIHVCMYVCIDLKSIHITWFFRIQRHVQYNKMQEGNRHWQIK